MRVEKTDDLLREKTNGEENMGPMKERKLKVHIFGGKG